MGESGVTLQVCQFGAGRIGAIHAASVAASSRGRLRYVVDPDPEAAARLAERHGATPLTDPGTALADPEVDAVVIASSTNTHVELILASARAGKAIFCEKPIDLDLGRADACVAELEHLQVPLMMGFNRRFDPSFSALREAVQAGAIGRVEGVAITSRDSRPPALEYVRVSGGLFRDMAIHDFDMARWILGAEPVEVFAVGSCLVEASIGDAGDVDTAMVVMRTGDGTLCHINNSRRAAYGYDQRIEVFGSEGMLQAGNPAPTTVSRWTSQHVATDPPGSHSLERYAQAYRAEIEHFLESLASGQPFLTGPRDGRQALALADAATESCRTGLPVTPA